MNPITQLSFAQRFIAFAINISLLVGVHRYIAGGWVPEIVPGDIWFFGIAAFWTFFLLAAPIFVAPRDTLDFALVALLLLVLVNHSGITHFIRGFDAIRGYLIGFYIFTAFLALMEMFLKSRIKNKSSLEFRFVVLCGKMGRNIGETELALVPLILISVQFYHQWGPLHLLLLAVVWTALRPAGLLTQMVLFLTVPAYRLKLKKQAS